MALIADKWHSSRTNGTQWHIWLQPKETGWLREDHADILQTNQHHFDFGLLALPSMLSTQQRRDAAHPSKLTRKHSSGRKASEPDFITKRALEALKSDDSDSDEDDGCEDDDFDNRAPSTMAAGSPGAAIAMVLKPAPNHPLCVPLHVCLELRESNNEMKKDIGELEKQLSLAHHKRINASAKARHEKRQLEATIQAEARKRRKMSREIARLQAENAKLKQTIEEVQGMCVLCLDSPAPWVAECGCQIFCDSCVGDAHRLDDQCPFCRVRVEWSRGSLLRLRL